MSPPASGFSKILQPTPPGSTRCTKRSLAERRPETRDQRTESQELRAKGREEEAILNPSQLAQAADDHEEAGMGDHPELWPDTQSLDPPGTVDRLESFLKHEAGFILDGGGHGL